jgi:hypothetical protein
MLGALLFAIAEVLVQLLGKCVGAGVDPCINGLGADKDW